MATSWFSGCFCLTCIVTSCTNIFLPGVSVFLFIPVTKNCILCKLHEHSRMKQGISLLLCQLLCGLVATPEWLTTSVLNINGEIWNRSLAAVSVIAILTLVFYRFSTRAVSLFCKEDQCCNFSTIILWKLFSITAWFSELVLKTE